MINDLSKLTYFIIDVDGTMTDSGLYFDGLGNELKRFSSRDFVGIMAAHFIGIKVVIVTGRESMATTKRSKELHIDYLFQNVKSKKEFIRQFMKEHKINAENLGYIGDDLNDYAAMNLAGFVACPSDACKEVQGIADYISSVAGGQGVIQDVFRWILEKMGRWNTFIEEVVSEGY